MRDDLHRRTGWVRRALVGREGYRLQIAIAATVVALFFLVWGVTVGHTIRNSGPLGIFGWMVILAPIPLGVFAGYADAGLLVAHWVAASILFGGLYYGSTTSAPDIPDPGLEFALVAAVLAGILIALPAYMAGTVARLAV